MYQDKMAFAIKVAGKVLREHGETVYLPFGSEYSLLIKNLNNRRACVRITLDGQEVIDGGLIVNANSSVDLERFVKSGQLSSGNRFKFIERTAAVEQHRGIGVEDGLIRFEFEFEKEPAWQGLAWAQKHDPFDYSKRLKSASPFGGMDSTYSASSLRSISSEPMNVVASGSNDSFLDTAMARVSAETATLSAGGATAAATAAVNLAGITVPGSISMQQFHSVSFIGDGKTHVVVAKLLGEVGAQPVKAPITVKTKPTCISCGHTNKAKAKFCSECGTSLESVELPSRYAIGDWVVCKGHKHMVKSIRFFEDKVYYGLAFETNLNGEVIEYPSDDVYPGSIWDIAHGRI